MPLFETSDVTNEDENYTSSTSKISSEKSTETRPLLETSTRKDSNEEEEGQGGLS